MAKYGLIGDPIKGSGSPERRWHGTAACNLHIGDLSLRPWDFMAAGMLCSQTDDSRPDPAAGESKGCLNRKL